MRHSNSKNLPYYFNPATKESKWEPPAGTDSDKLKTFMGHNHSAPGARPEALGATEGKIRASHLLVKHNQSRRASSWKTPQITRSKAEARDMLEEYQDRIKSGEISLGDLAKTESDCGSARKNGDLLV